ncbi:MAG: 3-dehydroquinate synthase [Actinomycetaceae bacterium]|nr:3-dehydroquinate synthase [Actinomycetaceae bacterium]
MSEIQVHAEHTYPVHIGAGLLEDDRFFSFSEYERILLIHPPTLQPLAERLAERWAKTHQVRCFCHPDGEAGKDVSVLAQAWEEAAAAGISRRDLVVGLGGGATTDLAGFVAATWLRGVDVVQIPTTLLAMVDAAVGGKTGINTAAGKNLAGAFHSPRAVVADTDTLATLPAEDFNAGMAEVIKCGCIRDTEILQLVEGRRVKAGDPVVRELIERAVKVKAEVVGSDLKEAGMREILNYGHTLAHAVEKLSNYRVRHGEAVAIGCIYASIVAFLLGYCQWEWVEKQEAIFSAQGLPTSWSAESWEQIYTVMNTDKKVRSGQIRMVLTPQPGSTRVEAIPGQVLEQAWTVMQDHELFHGNSED